MVQLLILQIGNLRRLSRGLASGLTVPPVSCKPEPSMYIPTPALGPAAGWRRGPREGQILWGSFSCDFWALSEVLWWDFAWSRFVTEAHRSALVVVLPCVCDTCFIQLLLFAYWFSVAGGHHRVTLSWR